MSGTGVVERELPPAAVVVTAPDEVDAPPAVPAPAARGLRRRPGFWWLLAGAVVAGLALRVAIGLTDDAPTTDEVAYIASGTALVDGEGFVRHGQPELHFPPLVPWLIGVTDGVVGDPHVAKVVLTCLAGAASVVPAGLTARRLAGDRAGAVAAWTAGLAPALATLPATRGAGTEAEYVLLALTSVCLAVTALDRPTRVQRLACLGGAGLAVGLAYLARPEGLAMAAPLGVAAVAIGWRAAARVPSTSPASRRVRLGGAAVAGLAFAVPLAVCVVPYASYLHDHTGSWALTAKTQDASIEAWHAVARGDREARDAILYELDETGLMFEDDRAPLTTLAREDPSGYAGILATNVGTLGKDLSGWWLLPLPLWGLAVWGAVRRRRSEGVLLVAIVGVMPIASSLAFFVQPRYLVVTAAMACVLVGVAAAELRPRWRRVVVPGGLALCLVASLVTFVGPAGWWHPTDHTDQQAAGEWIADHAGPDDRLMTRSFVVEHFAGQPAIAVPYADLDTILGVARHYGVRYLAVDQTSARRVRPQLVPLLEGQPVDGLRLVFESTAEGRTTRVFALDPAPPPSDEPGPALGFMGDGG